MHSECAKLREVIVSVRRSEEDPLYAVEDTKHRMRKAMGAKLKYFLALQTFVWGVAAPAPSSGACRRRSSFEDRDSAARPEGPPMREIVNVQFLLDFGD